MAEPVSINQFDTLIMFRKPVRTANTKGQVIETWTDHRKAIVKMLRSSIQERTEGERINIPGTITIIGHYDSNVTNTYRITFNGEDYNILSVDPLEAYRFMEVVANKVFE